MDLDVIIFAKLFYWGHQHRQHERERPDMERKYMNSDKVQRKEAELKT